MTIPHMPEEGGFDLCAQVFQNKETRHIPVLLITGLTDSDIMIKSYDAGCYDFIKKPINADELIAKTKNAISIMSDFTQINQRVKSSQKIAFDAMEQCNKMSNIIELAESSKNLLTLKDLAHKTFDIFLKNGIHVSLLFSKNESVEYYSSDKHPSPLELKLMKALLSSFKFSGNNRFIEIGGRLFAKHDYILALIQNTSTEETDNKDYISAILSFVNSQAKIIYLNDYRKQKETSYRINIINKFEASAVDLKDIFKTQISTINSIVDLIISEMSLKFASLDISEKTEKIISQTVKEALAQLENSVDQGGQTFEVTLEELLKNLHSILLETENQKPKSLGL